MRRTGFWSHAQPDTTAEGEVIMLYDNTYYLGQIFQLFLQDMSTRLGYGRNALASGDVMCAGADARLGSCLLAWLERRNIVLDIAYKATLVQMANACAALTSPCDASHALTQPGA